MVPRCNTVQISTAQLCDMYRQNTAKCYEQLISVTVLYVVSVLKQSNLPGTPEGKAKIYPHGKTHSSGSCSSGSDR